MKLMIGCPVRDRAWVIDSWFEHMNLAVGVAGVPKDEVLLAFVGDYEADDTFRHIDKMCLEYSFSRVVCDQPGTAAPYERVWGWDRYSEMVELRNTLLKCVRDQGPEYFWSLDSDILVAHDTLFSAFGGIEAGYDAVGSRCYMTPEGVWCPSYAMLAGTGGLLRGDTEGLITVDVIMAAKLMTPKAYSVDYETHSQGEDIGWSVAARAAGCKLGWDGRTISKHVMGRHYLDVVDDRCGY